MADRLDMTKLLDGLECCAKDECCRCPYHIAQQFCVHDVLYDALSFVRQHIPVEPVQDVVGDMIYWRCGKCGADVNKSYHYCRNCGKAVKWDG